MTPYHVAIIVVALLIPVVCGLSHTCQPALPQILDLSKIAIVGALGHAGQSLGRNVKHNNDGGTKL